MENVLQTLKQALRKILWEKFQRGRHLTSKHIACAIESSNFDCMQYFAILWLLDSIVAHVAKNLLGQRNRIHDLSSGDTFALLLHSQTCLNFSSRRCENIAERCVGVERGKLNLWITPSKVVSREFQLKLVISGQPFQCALETCRRLSTARTPKFTKNKFAVIKTLTYSVPLAISPFLPSRLYASRLFLSNANLAAADHYIFSTKLSHSFAFLELDRTGTCRIRMHVANEFYVKKRLI